MQLRILQCRVVRSNHVKVCVEKLRLHCREDLDKLSVSAPFLTVYGLESSCRLFSPCFYDTQTSTVQAVKTDILIFELEGFF